MERHMLGVAPIRSVHRNIKHLISTVAEIDSKPYCAMQLHLGFYSERPCICLATERWNTSPSGITITSQPNNKEGTITDQQCLLNTVTTVNRVSPLNIYFFYFSATFLGK